MNICALQYKFVLTSSWAPFYGDSNNDVSFNWERERVNSKLQIDKENLFFL